jgi:hypothetical protein
LDGDEVNSFADTAESLAVANIIKECYYEIISELQPKESEGLFHLDASTDNTKPCVMYLPATVSNIKHLKYNVGDTVTDTNFRDLDYMPVTQFFDYMNGLDSYGENWVDTQVVTMAGGDFNVKYRNDSHPSYWTSPDDHTIIFDSFDSSVETTLTSARTYGIGALVPTFIMSDTYVPQIDARQFQLLLNAAKAQAFVEIKQTANEKAERKERKHRILGYKTKDNTDNRTPLEKRYRKGYGR